MLKNLDDIFTSVVVIIIFIGCIFLLPIYILIADWSDDCYQCPFGIGSYQCKQCGIYKQQVRRARRQARRNKRKNRRNKGGGGDE